MGLMFARWSGKKEGRAQLEAAQGRDAIEKARDSQELDEHITQLGDRRLVDELRDEQKRE